MKTERLILSFIAALIGLLVAGVAFYVYQTTRSMPKSITKETVNEKKVAPTPDTRYVLTIDTPKDEEVVNKNTITVTGKTANDAIVVATSELGDQVIRPKTDGSFNVTMSVDDGINFLQFLAIFPNGEERKVTRLVTYATENF